jgi:hypothetical protein
MTIQLLKQTRRMNCGQTCVAMLAGVSIAQSEKAFGRKDSLGRHRAHKNVTNAFMQVKALTQLGCYPDPRGFMTPKDIGFKIPSLGLIRIAYFKQSGGTMSSGKVKRTGHLVVIKDGMIYDPAGATYTLGDLMSRPDVRLDSALEVLVP